MPADLHVALEKLRTRILRAEEDGRARLAALARQYVAELANGC